MCPGRRLVGGRHVTLMWAHAAMTGATLVVQCASEKLPHDCPPVRIPEDLANLGGLQLRRWRERKSRVRVLANPHPLSSCNTMGSIPGLKNMYAQHCAMSERASNTSSTKDDLPDDLATLNL